MDSVTPTVVKRPLLSLQCDWNEVLREKNGTAWVSCKEYGKPGKHGKLTSVESSENILHSIEASDGFKVESITSISLCLSHKDPNCKCEFFAPNKIFSGIHQKSVLSLDVTQELGVSVCSENRLLIWNASTGSVLRNLEGHVWDVYYCSFFPSGVVVLSAGADMQIKIWSAVTGECPVTLTGHKAAITDAAIVERGRNIVTVSKDGTARLWDCGKSSCLHVLSEENGNINCCDVAPVDIDVGASDTSPSDREVGTEGKLLLLGCETGYLKGVGLQSHKQIFQYQCDSAINCCCFISSNSVAFGTQDGKVWLFDLRARLPVTVWEESTSPVLCLISLKNGVFCGRADGTCIYISFVSDRCIQLTGPGFDPVYCMAFNGHSIYTGSRDGAVRKYDFPFSSL
ncbi:proteasomal ATPase-associated factor 1 [Trichonephila clavata]|uniref:Proteasomal ATPase-associated factor 1 n=1 Tax=Trichonephila clavata TaxID=2740835 RepID=A0A8X6JVU1_TRICU|nr:proteasomal ATPase-associated factor 1 [Trichonephila clavata]